MFRQLAQEALFCSLRLKIKKAQYIYIYIYMNYILRKKYPYNCFVMTTLYVSIIADGTKVSLYLSVFSSLIAV